MGGGSGTDTLIGGRQAATLLTKASWASGGLFLFLAVVLSIMSTRSQAPTPILRDSFGAPTTVPQPLLPGAQPAGPSGAQGAAPQTQQPKPAPATTTNR